MSKIIKRIKEDLNFHSKYIKILMILLNYNRFNQTYRKNNHYNSFNINHNQYRT